MTESHSKQAEQNAYKAPQNSILDNLFDTHRILNIAIIASGIGIIILLSLTYLLRNTTTVIHLGILASLMLILCAVLVVYKGMITANPYDRIQNKQQNTTCLDDEPTGKKVAADSRSKKEDNEDSNSQSDDSSLYEVIPKMNDDSQKKQVDPNKQN